MTDLRQLGTIVNPPLVPNHPMMITSNERMVLGVLDLPGGTVSYLNKGDKAFNLISTVVLLFLLML